MAGGGARRIEASELDEDGLYFNAFARASHAADGDHRMDSDPAASPTPEEAEGMDVIDRNVRAIGADQRPARHEPVEAGKLAGCSGAGYHWW